MRSLYGVKYITWTSNLGHYIRFNYLWRLDGQIIANLGPIRVRLYAVGYVRLTEVKIFRNEVSRQDNHTYLEQLDWLTTFITGGLINSLDSKSY